MRKGAATIAAVAITLIGVGSAATVLLLRSTATDGPSTGPIAAWHYAANGNFDSHGTYAPGAWGFNLADVSTVNQLRALPAADRALIYVGVCVSPEQPAFSSSFVPALERFIGDPRVFGFYLVDEPVATSCPPQNLRADSDRIHSLFPGSRTFMVLRNVGTDSVPSYDGAYTPQNTHVDLAGVAVYPVRSGGGDPDYTEIARGVAGAQRIGWPQRSLVPVYQTFGGGDWTNGTWVLPTPAQERQILAAWARVLPRPVFDYSYSWGVQRKDSALSTSRELQGVFARHNGMRAMPA